MLDSSGSVFDPSFSNWLSELSFVKYVVNNSLPFDTRVGLIIFSGCLSFWTFEQCKDYRLIKKWGLRQYGLNHTALVDAVSDLDRNDFLFGPTWTDDALILAYGEFANYSGDSSRSKMIVMVTDGNPTSGHEPCDMTGYESETLQNLKQDDVAIVVVAVKVDESDINDTFYTCLATNDYYFKVKNFQQLLNESLLHQIEDIVCANWTDPPTNDYPTNIPTTQPVSYVIIFEFLC